MSARWSVFVVAGLLISLAGCVKYEDSIELDANGKGSATIIVSRPEASNIKEKLIDYRAFEAVFSREEMSKELPPGIKLQKHERSESENRVVYTTVYTFDDINVLIGWAARKQDHPLRDISVKRTDTTIEFTRSIKPDAERAAEARKRAPDTVFTFRLKGPGKIETQNGTRVDNGAIVWEVKVADALEKGYDMKAAFFFGTPAWVYAVIGVAVLLVIIVAVMMLKKKAPVT